MLTLTIAICDDIVTERNYLKNLCLDFTKNNNILCKIILFSSGEEVLSYSGNTIDLLLLDIEMNGISGIDVMKNLEEANKVRKIVFVTNHTESVFDAFSIKTIAFGIKPILYEDISKWISIVIKESDYSILRFGDKYIKISDIFYISAQGNYIKIHTLNDEFLIRGNMRYWNKEITDINLLRVHKSYMVNLDYIEFDNTNTLKIIILDTSLPLGRAYKKAL